VRRFFLRKISPSGKNNARFAPQDHTGCVSHGERKVNKKGGPESSRGEHEQAQCRPSPRTQSVEEPLSDFLGSPEKEKSAVTADEKPEDHHNSDLLLIGNHSYCLH